MAVKLLGKITMLIEDEELQFQLLELYEGRQEKRAMEKALAPLESMLKERAGELKGYHPKADVFQVGNMLLHPTTGQRKSISAEKLLAHGVDPMTIAECTEITEYTILRLDVADEA